MEGPAKVYDLIWIRQDVVEIKGIGTGTSEMVRIDGNSSSLASPDPLPQQTHLTNQLVLNAGKVMHMHPVPSQSPQAPQMPYGWPQSPSGQGPGAGQGQGTNVVMQGESEYNRQRLQSEGPKMSQVPQSGTQKH